MTSAAATAELRRLLGPDRVRERVALAPFATFRIGGPADLFYEAENADELARAVTAARGLDLPWFLLGLGANLLIGDRGFRGLVIRNRVQGVSIEVGPSAGGAGKITAGGAGKITAGSGAVMWPDVIERTVSHGLSGLEHYAGIPSTVGGALWQNLHFLAPAPARERTMFIAEVTESAEILSEEGERRRVDAAYFEFGYDDSILHRRRDVVLTATFRLAPADPEVLRRILAENLDWRRDRHPPLDTEPSAGSIFKKIEGIGAGRLIDECGLKGARVGGALVTHRHANILINAGGATAADVRALIAHIQEVVARRTGYRLEVEIGLVGEF